MNTDTGSYEADEAAREVRIEQLELIGFQLSGVVPEIRLLYRCMPFIASGCYEPPRLKAVACGHGAPQTMPKRCYSVSSLAPMDNEPLRFQADYRIQGLFGL